MTSKTVSTFCRICEPLCGVLATVDDGKITKIGPNPNHVSSQGHFCKKASAMIDVTYDPDRILYPMKRTGGPGEFSRISWQQALDEICASLKNTQQTDGKQALAFYRGNPALYSYASALVMDGFCAALGIQTRYDADGEDGKAVQAAYSLLYGSVGAFTVPDLWHTDYALIIGANPLVSHGSSISEPRVAMALKDIRQRGGEVVVVDPRHTETARGNTYVPILAGSDAYFVSALIHEVMRKGWVDEEFVARHTTGYEALKQAVGDCTAEWAEPHTGIPASTIRQIAQDFATTRRACIHCRLGTSIQRFGTLTTMLIHCLAVITGHLGTEGGLKFSAGIIDGSKFAGSAIGINPGHGSGLPDVGGSLPSVSLISDIETPGERQVKALVMLAANPCLSSTGAGPKMDAALQKLDLFVSLDIYMNESNRFADYILPAATMFEREDVPLLGFMEMVRPTLYATEAVIPRQGESREEWEVLDEICRKLGHGSTMPIRPLRTLAKLGLRIKPRHLVDLLIRTSSVGDRFGFRRNGLSLRKLQEKYPEGYVLHETLPDVDITDKLRTKDRKIHLGTSPLCSEMERLKHDDFYFNSEFPLRMIGLREKLTHNSWMHGTLSPEKSSYGHTVRIHPEDADPRSIQDGDLVRIRSPYGELEVEAKLSDAMNPGNLALPHGWGHQGGWQKANALGGVNSNLIASDNPEDMDKVSGIATLNGIPVQLSKVL